VRQRRTCARADVAPAQAGLLSVTSHRLVWLSAPGAASRALGLGLASVSELCPAQKQQLFGSRTPRLRLRVFVDGAGVLCSGERLLRRPLCVLALTRCRRACTGDAAAVVCVQARSCVQARDTR
jgi:hypothetical protein